MRDPNDKLHVCMKEYCDHGVPSFPVFIWLSLSNELHLFNIWFN